MPRARAVSIVVFSLAAVACGGRSRAPVRPPPVAPAAPAAPATAAAPSPPPLTGELGDFEFVVDVMKRSYAGYPDKVRGRERELEQLTNTTREAIVANPADAAAQIRAWLTWFKDDHVGLEDTQAPVATATTPATATPPPAVDEGARDRALAGGGERVEVTPAELKAASRKRRGDTFAGLWETADGAYRVLVRKPDPKVDRWLGVVVAATSPTWSAGQVKFHIAVDAGKASGTFRVRDHSEYPTDVTMLAGGDLLRFDALMMVFRRVGTTFDPDRYTPSREFFLRPLSAKTLWLRLPNFGAENRTVIEDLLSKNKALLEKTPNLVIDLRYNGGGIDFSFNELMRWVYSRPIYKPGTAFRVSPDNLRALEAIANDTSLPDDMRGVGRHLADRIRAAPGEWASWDDKSFEIHVYGETRPSPQHVGILITGAASSGEQFIADARFSHKVTLFGQNTAGVLDYSNVLSAPLPSGKHILRYSSSRSLRLPDEPFDGEGIPPDIRLDATVEDQIGFMQRWLEARSDAAAAAAPP